MLATLQMMRVGMPPPPALLAQAVDDQFMLAGWKWLLFFLAGLAVTFLVFIIVVKMARKTLDLDDEDDRATESVLSLTELRRLRDAGDLTQEQYEKLRDKFAAVGERKLTRPKPKPKEPAQPLDKPGGASVEEPADDAPGPAEDSDNAADDGADDNAPAA